MGNLIGGDTKCACLFGSAILRTLSRTVGGLRAVVEDVEYRDDYEQPVAGDSCLCPVDVPTTLVNCGYKVWRSDHDSMAFEAEYA